MDNRLNILLVEHNPIDIGLVQDLLLRSTTIQTNIIEADTLLDACDALQDEKIDLILLDLHLPDSQGLETFNIINNHANDIPIIILNDLKHEQQALSAIRQGAQDYLIKRNFDEKKLALSILFAIERKHIDNVLRGYVSIIENTDVAILTTTFEGIITSWNNKAEKLFGYKSDEILGQPITLLFPKNAKEDILQILQLIKNGRTVAEHETQFLCQNNATIEGLLIASPIKTKSGQIISVSIICHDITERKLSEQQLAVQLRIATALAESSHLAHAAHSILKAICEIFNWQIGEIWALDSATHSLKCVSNWTLKDVPIEVLKDKNHLTCQIDEGTPGLIFQLKTPFWVPDVSKDKAIVDKKRLQKFGIQSFFGFPILFRNEILGVVLFFSHSIRKPNDFFLEMFETIGRQIGMFIKRKRLEGDLLYLAQHDTLTGLANRSLIKESFIEASSKAAETKDHVALLYLDLDHFKPVNDTYGHLYGDHLLRNVAQRFNETVRESDSIARIGGDEFVIVLPSIKSNENIILIAKKIIKAFSHPFPTLGHDLSISISIGISIFPQDSNEFDDLLEKADQAMYRVKKRGGNDFEFWNLF